MSLWGLLFFHMVTFSEILASSSIKLILMSKLLIGWLAELTHLCSVNLVLFSLGRGPHADLANRLACCKRLKKIKSGCRQDEQEQGWNEAKVFLVILFVSTLWAIKPPRIKLRVNMKQHIEMRGGEGRGNSGREICLIYHELGERETKSRHRKWRRNTKKGCLTTAQMQTCTNWLNMDILWDNISFYSVK